MPAIHLFQRRTLYGGDDLHVLALVTATARLAQLLFYAVLAYHSIHYVSTPNSLQAQDDDLYRGNHDNNNARDLTVHHHHEHDHTMQIGISTLEFGWMDAVQRRQSRHLEDASSSCQHLFPLLLASYTFAGIVFGIASLLLLGRIYHVSSQGCPTIHRHPRTERMEQLLEWLFLPMNILHFVVWLLGVTAMGYAISFEQEDECNTIRRDDVSTFWTVLWIASGVLLILSQAIEIVWNGLYVFILYYQDPHALIWAPVSTNSGNNNNNNTSSTTLLQSSQSYHSSSTSLNNNPNNNEATIATTALQPPVQAYYDNHALVEQMWADRCQNCCQWLGLGTCYMFGGKDLYGGNGAMQYGDFARAMADYLETRGVLDVVPSDIIVGFLVLQQLQVQRRLAQRHEVLSEHSRQVSSYFMNNNNNVSANSGLSQQAYDINDHRANIANGNSPNGMRLSRSTTSLQQQLLPQDLLAAPIPTTTAATQQPPRSANLDSEALLKLSQSYSQSSQQQSSSNKGRTSPSNILGTTGSMDAQQRLLPNNNNNNMPITNDNNKATTTHHHPTSPPPPKPKSYRRQLSGSNSSNHSQWEPIQPEQPPRHFQRLLSEQHQADVLILQEGARYAHYALAIYTWYLYLYVHPITGIPRLIGKAWNTKCSSGCCCCCSAATTTDANMTLMTNASLHTTSSGSLNNNNNNGTATARNSAPTGQHDKPCQRCSNHNTKWEGDNLCQAHKHALLLAAKLENEADLVYVQLKSTFSDNPYCILLDHEMQTVILSVRGTFSLEDCVTDVLLEPESLEGLGDEFGFGEMARGQHCHGGVLACARNVYRDLKRHGSLEYLLETKYPHYQLRLVGHSLGAATATLLGFMLKPAYPTLQVFNYSPPGATMTWDMAIQCQPWCTSFVLDTELVPRLSFEALEYLRDEVLDLIGRIRVSKLEVARRVATKTFWCGKKKTVNGLGSPANRTANGYDIEQAITSVDELDDLLKDLLLPAHEVPNTPEATSYRQQLEQFQNIQSERRSARGTRRAIRLFPPGKILHLVKTDEEQSCGVRAVKCITCGMSNAGSLYTPVWIGNGDLNEIVISPTMGTDHFPDRMVEELDGIVRNFGLQNR